MKNIQKFELAEFANLAAGISRFREAPRAMLLSRAPGFLHIDPVVFPESLRPDWELIMEKLTQQEARFRTFEDKLLDRMVHSILTMSDTECRMLVKQILDLYQHLQEKQVVPNVLALRRRCFPLMVTE
ncbi:hypothetical protein [Telluribacter sp. SYSU D00476]|uniref:hypothetical protein n=1 Tax=Telluribacter sp. SYSU D00476 TaxID=2811430 RepID=UPI001FF6114A|nr:hypothetical protein [Telluribacter sp. SYSU D00476]